MTTSQGSGNVLSMLVQAARDFLMLLVTVDPLGTVVLFVPLTASLDRLEQRKVARKAVALAGVVLVGFLVAGEILLANLGIRLLSFQLAGGVVLFLFGLQMVFGTGVGALRPEADTGHDIAVFPLALPAIASPGAITAVVLLTDNHRHSLAEQIVTAIVVAIVLAITLVLLYTATSVHRILGTTGANVIIRVLGSVLTALATEQIVSGIEALLPRGAG
jgi:multiple antibiotic resistance protein